MTESRILTLIADKESDKEKVAEKVMKKPELLAEVLAGLEAKPARIKYGCGKIIRIISEKKPEMLYPKIDYFFGLLDHENNIFRWEGIHVIGNLARVDAKNKINKNFAKYFAPIPGPVMITAANVIGGAAKIALAKPKLTERITQEILKVEKAKYKTAECRNVALGQAIYSFDQFFGQIKDKESVIKLVKKQRKNTRNSTRKAAEKFSKKHKID
ncbi:hypothetical protein ACFL02_06090 [Planctomycetota bacterium]